MIYCSASSSEELTTYHFPDEHEFETITCYSPLDGFICAKKPFGDVTAEEYLEFAKAARLRGGKAGLVDALSNAKRCFHYQVDRLLYRYGLRKATMSMVFPEKLQLLSELKIMPGTLLRLFNKERNAMEHDYTSPTEDTVDGSIDLCELLLLATDRYLQGTPARLRIKLRDDPRDIITLLDPSVEKLQWFKVKGSSLENWHEREVYADRILDMDSRPLEGIEISRLENEDIELSMANKQKWIMYLKLYASDARGDDDRALPEENMAVIMHSVPSKILKDWLEAGYKERKSSKEQTAVQPTG